MYSRLAAAALAVAAATAAPPKVIFHVVVDDLGWGDTSYHAPTSGPRDAGISTPHMAALAAEGVLLDRLYVYHMCTPSRSSFLSGRLPVHVEVALPNPEDPNQGVPRNMTTIATRLRRAPAGYQTHVVGKCA
jgi:arylsulfatase B